MKSHYLHQPLKKNAPDGSIVRSSQITLEGLGAHEFFFRHDREMDDVAMDDQMNHHLLAHLMPAMRVGGKLRVAGRLDRQMVMGLESYMRYWVRWCPDRLHMVEIEPEEWVDEVKNTEPGLISCFSGGADSWYSVLKAGEDLGVPLKSVMFMLGHDMPRSKRSYFDRYANQCEALMQQRAVSLIRLETNARETAKKFQLNWGSMAHGIFLAAGMHLFSHSHTAGCFPSSDTPTTLIYPWGSNPVTDPLLSSSGMKMHYHDCMVSKFEKICELVKHPACCATLRVCYLEHQEAQNCGRCRKCVHTLMKMHVAAPNSWREAFPNVRDEEDALDLLAKTDFSWWVLQHFEYAREHALRHSEPRFAQALDQLVERKRLAEITSKMKWRRLFYDAKVRLYTRFPELIKKGHGK